MIVTQFLSSRDSTEASNLEQATKEQLTPEFKSTIWGMETNVKQFTSSNYASIFKNEFSQGLKNVFNKEKRTADDLERWLGSVEYSTCNIYRKALFKDGHKSNRGWRITLLGLPSINCLAIGIATSYGFTQADNKLEAATRLLRQHLVAALGEDHVPGRSMTHEDRHETRLLYRDTDRLAGIDFGQYDVTVRFKHLRTSTVKRLLASFVTFTPMNSADATDEALMDLAREYRTLAERLVQGAES